MQILNKLAKIIGIDDNSGYPKGTPEWRKYIEYDQPPATQKPMEVADA